MMEIVEKIAFQVRKIIRIASFNLRYRINSIKTIEGIRFPVDLAYGYNVIRFIDNGEYEGGEIFIIKNTLHESDKVLEIGTGLGFISAYCSKKIGSENVYTFEANVNLEENIRLLYKINQVSPNLDFAILSDNEKWVDFFWNKNSLLGSSTLENRIKDKKIIKVASKLLNNEIARIKPSYFIMDIEGGEYDVFKIIAFQSIKKIQFELHPQVLGVEKCDEIFSILKKNRFVKDTSLCSGENYYYYLPE